LYLAIKAMSVACSLLIRSNWDTTPVSGQRQCERNARESAEHASGPQ